METRRARSCTEKFFTTPRQRGKKNFSLVTTTYYENPDWSNMECRKKTTSP